MKVTLPKKRRKSGFSLVEMLVVIAVIGVIAAIAIPQIGRINRGARFAKDQRNAQQVASIVAAAQAAGYDFVAGEEDIETIIEKVVTGYTLTVDENPSLVGTYFGVPDLEATDITGAANFLKVSQPDGLRLLYDNDMTDISTYD